MTSLPCYVETFPALEKYRHCRAVFLAKQPDLDLRKERDEALRRLRQGHMQALKQLGFGESLTAEAEQVHGNSVAVVGPEVPSKPYAGADALITSSRNVHLKIVVADCAAVYLVDRKGRAIGLVHSGRKGTELEIVPATIRALEVNFQILPKDLILQISPCIRPPHYEVDFATAITHQALAIGVTEITDCGICTACHSTRYYSYRMEKGKTGRMAAILSLI